MHSFRDIFNSVRRSIQRNGLVTTIRVVIHYLRLKLSRSNYSFEFSPLQRKITLRPGNSDFSVFRQIFMNGEYDLDIPGTPYTIIDAGANIGLAALHFHNQFPSARIFSIEPDPANFELLKYQTKAIGNIHVTLGALWGSTEVLQFANTLTDSWGIQVQEANNLAPQGAVRGIDLKSFMMEHNIAIIDLLKIDIEGSEWELLTADYEHWMNRTKVIIIELHETLRPGVERKFRQALNSIHHKVYVSGENYVVINLDLP